MATHRPGARHGRLEVHRLNAWKSMSHVLARNEGTKIPQVCCFVDTESTAKPVGKSSKMRHTFRLGVATIVRREGGLWTRRNVIRFKKPGEFWKWLAGYESSRRPVWLFAHNAAFDITLLGFWDLLDRGAYSLDRQFPTARKHGRRKVKKPRPWKGTVVSGDPPTIICVRSERGTLRIVDTFNYFQTSLEKMGQDCKLPKLPFPDANATEQYWFDYCQRDVEVIERVMCGLLDRWEKQDCGNFQCTAAGLAWSAFRHHPKSVMPTVDHSEPHTSMARDAYYAGEVTAFYIGPVRPSCGIRDNPKFHNLQGLNSRPIGPVVYLDCCGFHSWIMQQHFFPMRFLKVQRNLSLEKFALGCTYWQPIARVLIESDTHAYPFRGVAGTLFPTGSYWTNLAGPELFQAATRGHVRQIAAVAWYIPGKPFDGFIADWWKMTQQAEQLHDASLIGLCKLVRNALSGKIAQREVRWRDQPGGPVKQPWGEWTEVNAQTKEVSRCRALAGHRQVQSDHGEGKDACPAIGAYITSYGRCRMEEFRHVAGQENVLYQAADALLCTIRGYDRLEAAGHVGKRALGKLEEKWRSDDVTIFGPKDYVHDGQRVIAGVKEKAVPIADGVFEQESFQNLESLLTRKPRPAVDVSKVTLTLRRESSARAVQPDGWTAPLRIVDKTALPF